MKIEVVAHGFRKVEYFTVHIEGEKEYQVERTTSFKGGEDKGFTEYKISQDIGSFKRAQIIEQFEKD